MPHIHYILDISNSSSWQHCIVIVRYYGKMGKQAQQLHCPPTLPKEKEKKNIMNRGFNCITNFSKNSYLHSLWPSVGFRHSDCELGTGTDGNRSPDLVTSRAWQTSRLVLTSDSSTNSKYPCYGFPDPQTNNHMNQWKHLIRNQRQRKKTDQWRRKSTDKRDEEEKGRIEILHNWRDRGSFAIS